MLLVVFLKKNRTINTTKKQSKPLYILYPKNRYMAKEASWGEPAEPPTYIRYKGIWDMQDLYEAIYDWFRSRKYKMHEKVYKHKHPSPFGVERQYVWDATRKENDFIQFNYNMYIHTYDAHDVEVVTPDGKKKTFTKGRIWIEIKSSLTTDWEGNWKDKSGFAKLKGFYNKYIIRRSITQGWNPKKRYEMYELQAMVKARLKMEADEYEHIHRGGVHRRF